MTVPFALAAGLATLNNSQLVVAAGVAELVAGSISMGLGGFLSGYSDLEHYDAERKREKDEVERIPQMEEEECYELLLPYGVRRESARPVINDLMKNKELWVDFMMRFELNLEKPTMSHAWRSAFTIGISYFIGGALPLLPYINSNDTRISLIYSAMVTISALFLFGYWKSKVMGVSSCLKSAIQMAFVGSLAAGSSFGVSVLINQALGLHM